jgi:hypothetical protein
VPVPAVVFLSVALVIVLFIILLVRRAEKQRTEAMRIASSSIGFSFEPVGDLDNFIAKGDLHLFHRGHSKRLKNVLSGRAGDCAVELFDYQYTVGGGKESHTSRQTVAFYPGSAAGLPDFILAPEHVFHRIGRLFGYQDINFETNPEFSSRYLLRGPDETAIRAAFQGGILSAFERQPGWTVEVARGTVAFYRARKRVKPEEMRTFLDESRALLQLLSHR